MKGNKYLILFVSNSTRLSGTHEISKNFEEVRIQGSEKEKSIIIIRKVSKSLQGN